MSINIPNKKLNQLLWVIMAVLVSTCVLHAQPASEYIRIESNRSGASITLDRSSLQMVFKDPNLNNDAGEDSTEIARLSFDFDDSSGNFIPPVSSSSVLRTIRIPLDNIQSMDMVNGFMQIKYTRPVEIPIEHIRDRNGVRLLDHFNYIQLTTLKSVFDAIKIKYG